MTTPDSSRNASAGDEIAGTDDVRSRSLLAVVYTATTVLGGIGALVVLVVTATAPDASALDVLLWGALAVLLFAAAAREWWFKGIENNRSRRAAQQISPSEIVATARESSSEVATIRKLRRAHPDLRLVDAVTLVRDGKPSDS